MIYLLRLVFAHLLVKSRLFLLLQKRKMGKKESRVTKVEVAQSSGVCWKERELKKKGGEEVIEEDV